MLQILKFGFIVGAALGCTEVVRTCNNCYVSFPSPNNCVATEGANKPQSTCIGYLNNNIGTIAVTWNAIVMGQPNYCKQLNCYQSFVASGQNTITYTKSCNAGCNSTTLARTTGARIASTETYVNITSATFDACVNMCIEIAYTGKKCTVSHSGSFCYLYEDSTCTGGSCDTQTASTWTVVVVQCDFTVCPNLTNPADGSVDMSGVVVGSIATFSCNTGYVALESQTLTCQSDGTWNSVIPTCQTVSCGMPNVPLNGVVSAPLTTYLATATFSCDSGYSLSGLSSTTCQANGTWSSISPTCNPVSCETFIVIINGNFSASETTYLATGVYSCNLGYLLSGQNSTIYQENGTWSGTLPACNPVDCGTPPVPSNCTVTASGTTYLQSVVYACVSGYLLIGEKNTTCQANMTWSGIMPTCQPVDCGQPPFPANGLVLATNTTYLHQALYECKFGYRLEGHNTSVCLSNGSWSDSLPSCVLIDSTFPTSPENGSVNSTGTANWQGRTMGTGYNLFWPKC